MAELRQLEKIRPWPKFYESHKLGHDHTVAKCESMAMAGNLKIRKIRPWLGFWISGLGIKNLKKLGHGRSFANQGS